MGYSSRNLLKLLPDGASITDIFSDPTNKKSLLVQYEYQNNVFQSELKRRNIQDLITYKAGTYFLLTDGLTINDLYDLYSQRYNLDLVKEEDYENDETLIVRTGVINLPIRELSLKYIPTFLIAQIVDSSDVFINDESTRDLTDVDVNPFKGSLEKELLKLGTILFNGVNLTCFNKNLLTLDFRNYIISTLNKESVYYNNIVNQILTSKIIEFVNDDISDVIFLSGADDILFLIRFTSKPDDTPTLD